MKPLQELIPSKNIIPLSNHVLNNENFNIWSGSGYKHQHHYGDKGLVIHTTEVVNLMFNCASTLSLDVDDEILFLSGLFHDFGKIWDYQKSSNLNNPWIPAPHKRNIHHISQSAIQFNLIANKLNYDPIKAEKITHCILSHHMDRSFGSPVSPNSKEAWLLSLCDNLSARCNDCDTWDLLPKKSKVI